MGELIHKSDCPTSVIEADRRFAISRFEVDLYGEIGGIDLMEVGIHEG